MKIKTFFLVLLIFVSCGIDTERDIKNIENLLAIQLKDGYQIKNEEYDIGIGESIKSFDIVFDDSAFDLFFEKVKDEFIIIDKTTMEDIQINIDYYKNFEFDGVRIHMSIDLNGKTLHYSYVDL